MSGGHGDDFGSSGEPIQALRKTRAQGTPREAHRPSGHFPAIQQFRLDNGRDAASAPTKQCGLAPTASQFEIVRQ
jgi:hypothetical protein